jgi:hypothetical protein
MRALVVREITLRIGGDRKLGTTVGVENFVWGARNGPEKGRGLDVIRQCIEYPIGPIA